MKMSPELKARLTQPESRAEYAFKFISQWTKDGASGHAMNVWSEWLDVVNETVEPTELY
jgi:hypothetical protein